MKIMISFAVGPGEKPNHRDDAHLRKVFDVEWPGRPMPGDIVEPDIPNPIDEEEFRFANAYWSVEPGRDGTTAWFSLTRIVVDPEAIWWGEGFNAYAEFVKKNGWEVTGGWGMDRKAAA